MLGTVREISSNISVMFFYEFLHMDTSGFADQQKSYIYQLCANTRCRLEDFSRAINDRDGWPKKV